MTAPRSTALGLVILYRPAQKNFCPACAGTAWHVGRSTAECARCAFALPITPAASAANFQGK